jgi:hypothetical protein
MKATAGHTDVLVMMNTPASCVVTKKKDIKMMPLSTTNKVVVQGGAIDRVGGRKAIQQQLK